jgi:hypothetical protein
MSPHGEMSGMRYPKVIGIGKSFSNTWAASERYGAVNHVYCLMDTIIICCWKRLKEIWRR